MTPLSSSNDVIVGRMLITKLGKGSGTLVLSIIFGETSVSAFLWFQFHGCSIGSKFGVMSVVISIPAVLG